MASQDENNKYHWVKAVTEDAKVSFGEEWHPASVDIPDNSIYLCGCDFIAVVSDFEIGLEIVPPSSEVANITCGDCGFNAVVLVAEIQNSDWKCPRCRDQFAMAALAGFGCGVKPQEMARLCYEAADAMMEARKPKASG